MFCTKCGTAIQEGQAFCSGCGTVAGAQGQTPPAEQTVSEPSAPPIQAPPPMPPVQQYTPPAPPEQSYAPPPPAQQYAPPPAPNSAFDPPPAQPPQQPIYTPPAQPQQPIYTPPAQPQQPAYPQQPAAYDAYGQPQYAPPAPPAKKKAKWPIVLTIVVLLLIAVGATLFFVLRSPKSTLATAIAGLGTESLERLENSPAGAVPILIEALTDGTVTVNFDYEGRYGDSARGNVTFASDIANLDFYLSGDFDMYGQNIDFEMFMDSERIAVGTRMFDSNYYGITYDTFREDFRTFGRTFGIDSATIDEVADIVETFNETVNSYAQDNQDFELEAIQAYIDIFSSILDRAEQKSQKTDIRVSGETYSVNKIDFLITKDVILGIMDDLYNELDNDDDLRDIYDSAASTQYGVLSYNDLLRELRDAIREIERNYDEDNLITLSFYIGSRNRLMRLVCEIDVTFDGYSEYYEIIADFGASVTDTWTLSVDGDEIIRWEYRERGSNFENTIVFADEFEFSSSWNPGTGAFTVSYYAGWNRGEISGTYKPTSDGFDMRFDDLADVLIVSDGTYVLEINASTGANIPQIDYINMDRWDEALLERIVEVFSELLMDAVFGSGGSGIVPPGPVIPSPGGGGVINSEIVGAWGFYDGTGTYFFWRTDYVEFYSDGGVYNYNDDDYGTWTLNGNNLSVTTQSGTTYTYTISLDGDFLAITDWDNDTGYFVRLW